MDPVEHARDAGLRYVTDSDPGITRRRAGKGFTYLSPQGKKVTDAETLARIRSLAIPPAWEEVWISPSESGHLQATGKDARHRKQYRYHPRWRARRDELKYERMIAFAQSLPKLRRQVDRDLRRRKLPREKVLAAVVRLLETTLIRVGNDEYARSNGSFGLTTMLDDHVEIKGSKICFEFRGKSGKEHEIDFQNRRLATIVSQCQELPGQELFQFIDEDGQVRDVTSGDVNDYLRERTGQEFTAKDFRTWAGTLLAARALQEFEEFDSKAAAKRNVLRAIEHVAERLGNTKAVCRKCYIHPAVVDAYMDKSLMETVKERSAEELRSRLSSLPPEEAAVLALLQERMDRDLHAKRQSRGRKQPSLKSTLKKSIRRARRRKK